MSEFNLEYYFNRGKHLCLVKHPLTVVFITMQPGRTNGDVFVSACDDTYYLFLRHPLWYSFGLVIELSLKYIF